MLLSICLIFCQFQPSVAYKSVAYKKGVYFVSLRIQFKCGKIRTRKTPNTDTFHFHTVYFVFNLIRSESISSLFLMEFIFKCEKTSLFGLLARNDFRNLLQSVFFFKSPTRTKINICLQKVLSVTFDHVS